MSNRLFATLLAVAASACSRGDNTADVRTALLAPMPANTKCQDRTLDSTRRRFDMARLVTLADAGVPPDRSVTLMYGADQRLRMISVMRIRRTGAGTEMDGVTASIDSTGALTRTMQTISQRDAAGTMSSNMKALPASDTTAFRSLLTATLAKCAPNG